MSRSRKKIKQSKANEKERLARKNRVETQEEFEELQREERRQKRGTDSRGKKIPKESERAEEHKKNRERKQRESEARSNSQYRGYARNAQVKVKRVLSKDAKKKLITWISIAVTVVVAIIAIIVVVSSASKNSESDNVTTTEQAAMALGGITNTGKKLFDSTGKFDGFWVDESGVEYDDLYDSRITIEDAKVLKEYGQYPNAEGIYGYNEERSINDRSNLTADDKIPSDEGADAPAAS